MLSSELLGYPPEARVLIINADDFGMYPSVNNAVLQSIENGIASSCSLMPPCPGARQALQLLQERPHIPFGGSSHTGLRLRHEPPGNLWLL